MCGLRVAFDCMLRFRTVTQSKARFDFLIRTEATIWLLFLLLLLFFFLNLFAMLVRLFRSFAHQPMFVCILLSLSLFFQFDYYLLLALARKHFYGYGYAMKCTLVLLFISLLFSLIRLLKIPILLARSTNSFTFVVAYCPFYMCANITNIRIYAYIFVYICNSRFPYTFAFKWICFQFHRRYFLGQSKLSPASPFCMHICI